MEESRAVTEICATCGKLAFSGNLVTLPSSEYHALKMAAEAGRSRKSLSTYRAVSRNSIARQPELADFIVECAARMTTREVREACIEKFGDRTPSRSTIFRFIADMQNAAILPAPHR